MSKTLRWTAVLGAVIILGVAAVSAGTADAAKGGSASPGGGKHGGGGTSGGNTASMTYAPNPVPVGSSFTVQGTGFIPNTSVLVGFSGSMTGAYAFTDSTGAFSYTYTGSYVNYCNTYLFTAQQGSTTTYLWVTVKGCP